MRDTVRAIDDANKRGRRLPNGRRITAKEFKRQQEQRDRERIALNDHRAELEQEEQDWKAQLNVAKEEMYAIAGSVQRMTIVQRTKEKDLDAVIEKLESLKKVLETEKKTLRREEIKAARKFSTLKKDIIEREERLLKMQRRVGACIFVQRSILTATHGTIFDNASKLTIKEIFDSAKWFIGRSLQKQIIR